MNKRPKISTVIPTYNAEDHLETCLKAVFSQDYPKTRLEVFVVDNYSTDRTLKIAKKYKTKILMNKVKDAQASKMLGLSNATGELFIYLDADIEIAGKDWFKKMAAPLLEDRSLTASFTRYVSKRANNSLVRYLSYDVLQRDPIYEFFSPSVESTIVEKKKGYFVCRYKLGEIAPSGLCLFRKKALLEVWDPKHDPKYLELDSLVKLVQSGHNRFAYVPSAGMYHPFVGNLNDILKKRLRNIRKNYLGQPVPRLYTWFDLKNPVDLIKIFLWTIYATTLIGPAVRGLYKSVKHKDIACMWEPIVAFTETWVIIYGFIRYSFFSTK